MPDQAHAAKSTAPPVDDLAVSTATAADATGRETITQAVKTMSPSGQIA